MVFIVKAKHDVENCPIGPTRPNLDFLKALREQTEKSGVKVIGAYSNPPSHTHWFIIEAETMEQITTFSIPLLQIGKVKTIPVQLLEGSPGFWTGLGLQR